MTMQITGWILMQMQIGPGKAGRGALPSHSYLEFATYRLLTSAAGGNLLGCVAEARKARCVGESSEGLQIPYGSPLPWALLVVGEAPVGQREGDGSGGG